jgi:hypothetical protein
MITPKFWIPIASKVLLPIKLMELILKESRFNRFTLRVFGPDPLVL